MTSIFKRKCKHADTIIWLLIIVLMISLAIFLVYLEKNKKQPLTNLAKALKEHEEKEEEEYYNEIKSLLEEKPELINDHNQTILHEAALLGWVKAVKYLIRRGADINAKDDIGQTSLHRAASNGRYEIVRLLIRKGADIHSEDMWGRIPLEDALSGLRFVNDWKDDPNAPIDNPWLTKKHENLIKIVKLFLDKGIDVNYHHKKLNRPLWMDAVFEGKKEIVEIFISYGADVNIKANSGITALHLAALRGHKEITKLLIKAGAEINAKADIGATPLGLAKHAGFDDIVKVLIENGAEE